ncbi:emp24/gp25L/p24 family protein [Polychaeton citri CBS 116435]|uniref:Emp24/gp25L/p24 family protein n=1 Tax=Polychaeton citri CBS 116435 TaxID=1314669 RepID=A0A9P4QG56_9PEZI|nr:emp24/gp25L/p24 family protein [Polychaeton citri CBS 116435]
MRMIIAALAAFLGLLSFTSATALTYKLMPNERECFYAWVDKPEAKVAFYFAVQSGGSFDINYAVYGPNRDPTKGERVILGDNKERQGDFVFTALETGEYRFCFDNSVSTFSDKVVDFEISVENEPKNAELPQKAGASTESLSGVEETVIRLSSQISTLTRQQKYFRTRENRNFSTVRSTEKRIFNFSLMESGLMVAMAGLQVFIVKMFFTGGRKGYV